LIKKNGKWDLFKTESSITGDKRRGLTGALGGDFHKIDCSAVPKE
jgi:hypothetical protein